MNNLTQFPQYWKRQGVWKLPPVLPFQQPRLFSPIWTGQTAVSPRCHTSCRAVLVMRSRKGTAGQSLLTSPLQSLAGTCTQGAHLSCLSVAFWYSPNQHCQQSSPDLVQGINAVSTVAVMCVLSSTQWGYAVIYPRQHSSCCWHAGRGSAPWRKTCFIVKYSHDSVNCCLVVG